jgi:uncharacterized protein YbjT (DUF2867 family)
MKKILEHDEKQAVPVKAPHVLVTAANGRTGRAVIRALAGRGCAVSAMVHNAADLDAVRSEGATESFAADLLQRDSFEAALNGVDCVVHIGPPMHPGEVEMTGNVIAAMQNAGTRHLVYYSVMHPLRFDVRHHRLKLDSESRVVASGLPYTIVQPIRYMQHLDLIWPRVMSEGIHAMPFNTNVQFNVVDLADVAQVVAKVAGNPEHLYASYELAGPEALSQSQMAAIVAEVTGRDVVARRVSPDAAAEKALNAGLGEDRANQIRSMNEHYDEHGFLGNPNVLTWLLGRPPTSFRTYVEKLHSEKS